MAKLLLCVTMVLTFPLPFFTCRELLIVILIHPFCGLESGQSEESMLAADEEADLNELREPLLSTEDGDSEIESHRELDTASIATELSRVLIESSRPKNWLLPTDDRQLQLIGHVTMTVKLWIVTTCLAIAAPSLGDVLDLVGCATGTLIAFIIPALLSLQIEGYSHLSLLILLVGGLVGSVGTFFSVKKILEDINL